MSGYDIWRELVVQKRDTIPEHELALFQALQLELSWRAHGLQGCNSHIQIAMFLAQNVYFFFDGRTLFVCQGIEHGYSNLRKWLSAVYGCSAVPASRFQRKHAGKFPFRVAMAGFSDILSGSNHFTFNLPKN